MKFNLELVIRTDNGFEEKFYFSVEGWKGAKRELVFAVYNLWDDIVSFAKSKQSDSVRATLFDFDTNEPLFTKRIGPDALYGGSYYEQD